MKKAFYNIKTTYFEASDEVTVYFDDIILAAENRSEYKKILSKLVERAINLGI